MTCIVGLVDQETGDVWMGGDSAAVRHHDRWIRAQPKVFKVGPFVIGYTTSFRMGQLLQYDLDIKLPLGTIDDDPFAFMVRTFVPAARQCFKDGGFAEKDKEVEAGGEFLVGYRGHLYQIFSDYQVAESVGDFAAVGCAAAYALGALEVLQAQNAEEAILTALKVAEGFSAGVSEPFTVVRLPGYLENQEERPQ